MNCVLQLGIKQAMNHEVGFSKLIFASLPVVNQVPLSEVSQIN